MHCGARVAAWVVVRLALVVREARSWCGRRGTAMGRQHWACAHDTGFWALLVCLRARGDVRAVFTRAVCVEKGMRGAGRACLGVWEFGVCPEGVPEGDLTSHGRARRDAQKKSADAV